MAPVDIIIKINVLVVDNLKTYLADVSIGCLTPPPRLDGGLEHPINTPSR